MIVAAVNTEVKVENFTTKTVNLEVDRCEAEKEAVRVINAGKLLIKFEHTYEMIKIRINQYMKLHIVFITILYFLKLNCNAHHNFGLYYDSSKIVIITGIVKKYSYINPHIQIDLEVKQGDKKVLWQVESLNARLASTYNLKRDSFNVGDAIEIKGWPSKDGSKKLGVHQLALPSGEIFVLRRAPDQSPASPRFRSVHGFLGEFRKPSPKEALANSSNNQNNFSINDFEVPNRNAGFGTREGGRRRGQRGDGNGFIRSFPLTASLDKDANGEISESEIEGAVAVLELLDKNNDGKLTREEIRPNRDQSPYTAPTSDTSKAQTPLPENKSSELEEAQAEFIEHTEEAGFAVSALKELLAEDRPTKEAQMTEIENLQVALFNSKVLVQLIPIAEDALKHHDGDVVKAREGIKQALLKAIDYTLKIEKYIIAGNRKSAFEYLGELIKIQRQSHRIYQ